MKLPLISEISFEDNYNKITFNLMGFYLNQFLSESFDVIISYTNNLEKQRFLFLKVNCISSKSLIIALINITFIIIIFFELPLLI